LSSFTSFSFILVTVVILSSIPMVKRNPALSSRHATSARGGLAIPS
jgi:hypothetical protein